jgi:hypothetical protein
MSDWMTEEYGFPHKDGKVRWYVVGAEEDVYGYLGWYDMTDWDKGLEEVLFDARQIVQVANGGLDFQVLRHDQIITLANNVKWALEDALVVPGETTFNYWYKRKEALKGDSQE